MTQSSSNNSNNCLDARDPAIPGDPWSRLRYKYGQLLGAEDFEQEQTYFVLRRRLHNALLHGFGTAWGLRVKVSTNKHSQLLINHGLGFDLLGRAIHVDENEQIPCLDVSHIHDNHLFWDSLECIENGDKTSLPCPAIGETEEICDESVVIEKPEEVMPVADSCDDAGDKEIPSKDDEAKCTSKYAYVVISHRAGQSHKVPAITPSCDMSADEALVFSRITDQYFAEIIDKPPECDADIVKNWLKDKNDINNNNHCWHTLRDRLVDFILNSNDLSLEKLWNKNAKVPLLLAKITLMKQNGITIVSDVNNKVRPLLPSVQLLGEQMLGQKLNGEDKRNPLKLLSVEQIELAETLEDKQKPKKKNGMEEPSYQFKFTFSRPLSEDTFNKETVKVYRLEDGGWSGALELSTEVNCTSATINITNCIQSECITLQFYLAGSNQKPIVSQAGMPLDGWWDESVSGMGRGRNISFVRTWEKLSNGGEDHEEV